MMIDGKGHVRLTSAEHSDLRDANARNGRVVKKVVTADDLMMATLGAQDPVFLDDLLKFAETGSSPLTRRQTGD